MIAEFDFTALATVNATLNFVAFLLILAGVIAIKGGREEAHKTLMLTATGVSALFLVSYVTYHLTGEPRKFLHEGAFLRGFYFTVLVTHVVLAAVQVPLIVMTILHGLRDRREKHRRLAKITTPIWLYVSATGVLIYFMLYVL